MSTFNMYVITDTHYFASELGCSGEAYDRFMDFEQKCFAETQAINEAAFEWLGNAKDADTVLIAGDLSFNGERKSHEQFLKLLKKLKDSGKRILVITAGHDYGDNSFAFKGNERLSVEGTPREDLFDMYYDYGFSDALSVDRESLSYVTQLTDGVRLLALNCDGNGACPNTFPAREIEWILRQTKKAREDSQTMIAMTHYPLIPGSPVLGHIGNAVMNNAENIVNLLASEGVHLCFTGHMHNQSVKSRVTPSGDIFRDVCTGSLIGCPASMRYVTITDAHKIDIKTLPTPDFKWDFKGMTQEEYFQNQFDMMINSMLDCMTGDTDRLCGKIGLPKGKAMGKVLNAVGKKIDNATLASVCRLFHIYCPGTIADEHLRTLLTEIVRNIFVGDQPYVPGTPEYDVIMGVVDRLRPVLAPVEKIMSKKSGKKVDLRHSVEVTVGNSGMSDYNCSFEI